MHELRGDEWLRHVYSSSPPSDPEPGQGEPGQGEYQLDEPEPATRLMMRSVRDFRFRTAPGTHRPSLEVELSYDETPQLTGRTAAGQRSAEMTVTRVAGLVLTPRLLGTSDPGVWW